MKQITWLRSLAIVGAILSSVFVIAEAQPKINEEKIAELKAAGFETDPAVFQQLATGGRPKGRWKEGLTFEGIEPMPWLKSATSWMPGTEEIQADEEVRLTH